MIIRRDCRVRRKWFRFGYLRHATRARIASTITYGRSEKATRGLYTGHKGEGCTIRIAMALEGPSSMR